MTIGSNSNDGTYSFIITEKEYLDLLSGDTIVRITENSEYKKAKFSLSFVGEHREKRQKGE